MRRYRRMAAAGAVVLIVFMGGLLQRDLVRTSDADQWVEHTLEVLRVTAEARESIASLESGELGPSSKLAGRLAAAHYRAAQSLLESSSKLLALTQDNALQHARARKIAQEAAAMVDFAQREGHAGLDRMEGAQRDNSSLYANISQFQQEERKLLGQRRQAQRDQQEFGLIALALLVITCAALVGRSYVVAARHRRDYEAAEQRLRDLVEHLPLTVWQVEQQAGGQRRFVYLSPTAERERGWDAAALCGDYGLVSSTILPEDRARVEPALRDAQRQGGSFDVTYRARGSDDRTRWIHSGAHVRARADGSFLWSGFWRDVSRQVATEQALKDANRELQAFSYTVSHDLRTPLAAMMAFASAASVAGGPALPAQAREYLEKIRSSGAHMHELIEGLLSLGRLAQEPLVRSRVDVSEISRQELELLRATAAQRQVQAQVQDGLLAEGDPALLRRVMSNLIGNAWKFSQGSAHPSITVGRGVDGPRSYFFVRDNGIGFDQEQEERIFRPFQRLRRADEFPGIGIGLATVARIIERHGGQIWAESEPGHGASFFFTLAPSAPAREPHASDQPVAQRVSGQARDVPDLQALHQPHAVHVNRL